MFSCEFCEIFKNTFFIEHFRWLLLAIPLRKAIYRKRNAKQMCPSQIFKTAVNKKDYLNKFDFKQEINERKNNEKRFLQ